MDEAELKGLPRRVGQMTYEQVRTLLDENRQQIRAHNKAEKRGDFCPQCVWHVERRYARCAEQDAMLDAYRALSGLDPGGEAAILAITRHQATCPTCQTVTREWKHVDSCEARSQLHEIERVYAHQMLHLEMQERQRDRSTRPGQPDRESAGWPLPRAGRFYGTHAGVRDTTPHARARSRLSVGSRGAVLPHGHAPTRSAVRPRDASQVVADRPRGERIG